MSTRYDRCTNRGGMVAAMVLALLVASCSGQAKQAQDQTVFKTYYYLTSAQSPQDVANCISENASRPSWGQGKVRSGSSAGSYEVIAYQNTRKFRGISTFYEIKPAASGSSIKAEATHRDPLGAMMFKKKANPMFVKAETRGCAQLQHGELVKVPRSEARS